MMNNCNCNKCKKTCDCGPQKPSNNPCGGGCGSCGPAKYGCAFDIQVSPYDPSTWIFNYCGCLYKIKAPSINETCTKIYTNYSNSTLIYDGECGKSIIDGCTLGNIIELDCLRNVEISDVQSCDLLVFDPGCFGCGDGCKPIEAKWRNYHIPDADDCVLELDSEGFYKVLSKDDCGCIYECKLPVKPEDEDKIIYLRDSVPDDPDYPWYYGCYNENAIGLHLRENVPKWFGKYDLEVTINYGIQVIISHNCINTNFRSLVIPVLEDGTADPMNDAVVLQGPSAWIDHPERGLPWGTMSLRASLTFVVPKGKEATLHHEFRLRSAGSFPTWELNPTYDGIRVPDNLLDPPNQIPWTASRLNALQAIIKPTSGEADKHPVTDAIRNQLDPVVDSYPA